MRDFKRCIFIVSICSILLSGCKLLDGNDDDNQCMVNSNLDGEGNIAGSLILTQVFSRSSVQIYTTDLQGNRIIVTQKDSLFLSLPQLSPDSSKILVLVDPGITDVGFELYLMNVDGTDFRTANVFAYNPVWSPDGKHIAYEFCEACPFANNSNIYIYSLYSGTSTKLTDIEYHDSYPSWLPDGKTILFQSSRDTNDYSLNLFSVNIFSKEVKRLTQFVYPTEAVIPKANPLSGDIFYYLKQTDTLTSRSTYQTVLYTGLKEHDLINFEMDGFAQLHWSQNGDYALIFGKDKALKEAVLKMYSFSEGCFELKGVEIESSNQIIKKLTEFPIFQWYLR